MRIEASGIRVGLSQLLYEKIDPHQNSITAIIH